MDHSQFKDLIEGLAGKVIIEKLTHDLEIFDQFLITQRSLPHVSYTSYE